MPFCPVCTYEYLPGLTECTGCGTALIDELPPKPRPVHGASTADVVVARVRGQSLAEMWAELLGNQGIASRLHALTGIVESVYPVDGVYEVLVAAADAPRARSILPLPPER
jgi:hypothetical protein